MHLSKLPTDKYSVELASLNWDPKFFTQMFKGIWDGNAEEVKLKTGKKFYWAKPI
ncbi:hypothetical protein [Belliella baltica]|uniref:hypothetical protein n=1 Tax=Belliella baltica TaxID=232259 RepID=UPI0012F9DE39|nr:hypothetical protein [Belliella baltica]